MNDPTGHEPLSAGEAAGEILRALEGGGSVVEVKIIAVQRDVDLETGAGARLIIEPERVSGTLSDPVLEREAVKIARGMLASGTAATRDLPTAGGGVATLYFEPHLAPAELIVLGAGHIARPLCAIGAMLGFRVTVLDDRPDFATRERFPEAAEVLRADFSDPLREVHVTASTHLVLVTRGHKYDFDALRDLLMREEQPAYIGMVGSRRRVRAAFEVLAGEGISPERLAKVHAPIGLDIGAETPEEIAVAIGAEIVKLRRGGTGESLRHRERVVERWIVR